MPALGERAARYVAGLEDGDPVLEANRLIDRALRLQDEGRWEGAERLLAEAEALLAGEPS